MDRIRHVMNIFAAVMRPCRIPPYRDQPLSFKTRGRTRISRTQVLAIGIMSVAMIGILVTSYLSIFYPPILFQSATRYNTESVIVKFNENGVPIWEKKILIANASSRILFEPDSITIIKSISGGYAIASPILCERNGTKTWGVFLCRLDDSGNQIWNRTFDEIDIELDLSLVEIQSGDFAVAGTTRSFNQDNNSWIRRVFLIRTDVTGVLRWNKSFEELTGVWGHSLVACDNGDLAIAGTTEIHSDEDSNVMLARIDENGTLLWNVPLGGSLNDEGNSLLQCGDGGFIVVGSTQIEDNDKDVLMVRTAANGSIIWNRTYEDDGISIGWSVCSLDNGGFVVTGIRKSFVNHPSKTLFLMVDSDGELIISTSLQYDVWNRGYGYYDDCRGHAIVQSNETGFIIAGIIRYNQWSDDWRMMILRTDATGNLQSNSTYGENSWDLACSLVAFENQGYAVAGVRISPVG